MTTVLCALIFAATGPGAIEACARYTPDVVILDVGLPGLSGFDVARTLKRNGSRTKILEKHRLLSLMPGFFQIPVRRSSTDIRNIKRRD